MSDAPPPLSPLSTLLLALGTWAIAFFFVLSGYGGLIGLVLGPCALWPFGLFLRRQYHVSKLMLTIYLVAAFVIFFGLSIPRAMARAGWPTTVSSYTPC
jgi:hypothetical protein